MPITSPLPNDTRSRFADWLEILALTSSRGLATRSDLLGLYDLLGDEDRYVDRDELSGDTLESEILEDKRLDAADDIFEELYHRAGILQADYPFTIELRGQNWRVIRTLQPGKEAPAAQACYIFCLLTSAIRDRRIQGVAVPPLEQAMALHFQKIATEAAAEVIGGISISFGWPRPEGTAFRPALQAVSQRLRMGTPLQSVPLWASNKEKDSGIDVIAWREFNDARPGKLVLLGQVASGKNWTKKSVEGDTKRFFSWFSKRPTEHFIPAIFIPFPQHHDCVGRRDEAFEDVAADEAWLREQEFGLVVDRLRIVGAAAKRLMGGHTGAEAETLAGVNQWIQDALNAARAAA
jgi:hypothetical protein